MFDALLRVCFPASVLGAGVTTALGVSYAGSGSNSQSPSIPVVQVASQQENSSTQEGVSSTEAETTSLTTEVSSGVTEDTVTVTEESPSDTELPDSRPAEIKEPVSQPQEPRAESLQLPVELEMPPVIKWDIWQGCNIIDQATNVLKSISKNPADYYTASCINVGDENLNGKWTWLFPKSLFVGQEELEVSKKFDLSAVTDTGGDGDDLYGIALSSSSFVGSKLEGGWNYEYFGEQEGVIINLKSTSKGEKIYLY